MAKPKPKPKSKTNQYARTISAVAEVMGVVLFKKQRKRLQQQLAEVLTYTRSTDFPKKTAKGWAVASIEQWKSDNVLRLAEERLRRDAEHDVLNGGEVKPSMLKVLKEGQGERVTSMDHMAEILTRKFGVGVSAKDVSDWKNAKRLPAGAPAFPPPASRGGWSAPDDGIAWYEKWMHLPLTQGGEQGALFSNLAQQAKCSDLQKQIDEAAIKAKEREILEKSNDKNFVTVQEALAQAASLGVVVNQKLNDLEKVVPGKFASAPVWQLPEVQGLDGAVRLRLLDDLTAVVIAAVDGVKRAIGEAVGK